MLSDRLLRLPPERWDAGGRVLDPLWIPYGAAGLVPRGCVHFVCRLEHGGVVLAVAHGRVVASPPLNAACASYLKLFERFVQRILSAMPPWPM
jgi:hypothetical protein